MQIASSCGRIASIGELVFEHILGVVSSACVQLVQDAVLHGI